MAVDRPPDTDQIFTVANILSLIRLAGIPVFAYVLLADHRRFLAAWLLLAIACTDWVDGGVARKYHQVTTLGKVLDPTIDRMLLGVGGIAAVIDGSLPLWLAIVLIARELFIGLGGIVLFALSAARLSVTWWGKTYALGLMGAIPLFLVGHCSVFWHAEAEALAWILAVPSAIGSYATAASYAFKAPDAIRRGR
jgi:cardiolipin synthase (CMP-forming)